MKPVFLIVCGLAFFESFAFGRFNLNKDGIVGVSQKKFQEYVTKAIVGFKKVMLKGDEEMNYPIMEPYKLDAISWDFIDTSGNKKYSLNFHSFNETEIKGLSNYALDKFEGNAQDLKLSFDLVFTNVRAEIPYKLNGYFFKGILPVYGEGLLTLHAALQRFHIIIDLAVEKGFIVLENSNFHRYLNNANVEVTGLMDLPDAFAGYVMDDFLNYIVKEYSNDALQKYMSNLVEETIGGMTTDKFFKFLDHFVKKYDEK